jgi:hypothetical protein
MRAQRFSGRVSARLLTDVKVAARAMPDKHRRWQRARFPNPVHSWLVSVNKH